MISPNRVFLCLLLSGALAACGSKPDSAPTADVSAPQEERPEATTMVNPKRALIDACEIEMSEPNYHEWTTHWDPAFGHNAAENPSGVRSAHWASEEELRYALEGGTAFPFELSCGNGSGAENPIVFDLVAVDTTLEQMPLGSGSYPIRPRSMTGKNNPGEIVVARLMYDNASFDARSGTLSLNRFDSEGAAGSFVIEGVEVGGGNRPLRIEGTFDIPCRLGRLQYGCKSTKAERE